jgi:hypothetical protein
MGRAEDVEMVDEPFNLSYRPSRLVKLMPNWFQYVTAENASAFEGAVDFAFDLRYPLKQVVGLRTRWEFDKFRRQVVGAVAARRHHRRVLCKDPIAVFSAEWLCDRYGADTIVCIRHPAAFASSLMRLHWEFDFNNWLRQPLFMRDCAGPYADQIEEFAQRPPALIDQASLLWNVIYGRVHHYQQTRPGWSFIRHEDLACQPTQGFSSLYAKCGLTFTSAVKLFVETTSSSDLPEEVALDDFKTVVRNSAAAANLWRRRLSKEEVDRVRAATGAQASPFYTDADWG